VNVVGPPGSISDASRFHFPLQETAVAWDDASITATDPKKLAASKATIKSLFIIVLRLEGETINEGMVTYGHSRVNQA